jgi:hypothetical protein
MPPIRRKAGGTAPRLELSGVLRRLGLIALVVLTAALLPLAAAQSAAIPGCAPGGAPVTYTGTVTSANAKTYLVRPFEVDAATTRIEVTYDWADKPVVPGVSLPSTPLTQTVFDLGLWDQGGYRAVNGFRGWSGSRQGRTATGQQPVFVQQDVAQRGYRPGPIEPGTWHVELGVAAVGPTGASWTVTITCSNPVVGPAFVAQPVDPTHVADANPGWYRGDFHMHGYHSASRAPSWQEEVDYARSVGLDFLPITDYVTNQHWRELGAVQDANPDVVIWPGREIITYFGHMTAVGETPSVIEYRHGFEDVSARTIQQRTKADGALFQVNHPTTFAGPLFTNFCRGCAFDLGSVIDWSAVDTFEVLTGPILVDSSQLAGPPNPLRIQNPFTRPAIDLWVDRLMAGYKLTAVSGSDSKGVEGDANQLWGTNATVVWADQLSRPALKSAVQAGHVYVQTRGAQRSPQLEMTAVAPNGESGMFGDVLRSDTATMTVHVTGARGQLLTIYRNAQLAGLPVLITSEDFTYTFAASRGDREGPLGTFYRVETGDLQSLTTIGNPIYLSGPASATASTAGPEGPPAASPGAPRAGAATVAGAAGSAVVPATVLPRTGGAPPVLLALGLGWLAVALRPRRTGVRLR